ncbi:hypothetical protein ABTM96_20500, partial [Acinetobacter baumannii]
RRTQFHLCGMLLRARSLRSAAHRHLGAKHLQDEAKNQAIAEGIGQPKPRHGGELPWPNGHVRVARMPQSGSQHQAAPPGR